MDWEDMAEDSKHLYIGDFGNNKLERTHYQVLKINKKDMPDKKDKKVDIQINDEFKEYLKKILK